MIKVTKKEDKAWVTFSFSGAKNINSIDILGEWNEWKKEPMKQKKNGEFSITKILRTGESFEFGYKVNGEAWHKDDSLPSVASPFGSENALLTL